ncbi:DMT family transporter [Mycetohabitans endofungorum]|uniref:DMT family transporter n=1 Tax=Mycetohabitans endofungorum TaxID=417203 RepID=UPI002B05EE49|nr:DMT family transporter [Mycetohabitans endofungorum]
MISRSVFNVANLLALAALWSTSFLFVRIGVADFGVVPMVALRVLIGATFLIALLITRKGVEGKWRDSQRKLWPLFMLGVLNAAMPFCLFAYAVPALSVSLASVINATAPLWGTLVAFLWLGDRPSIMRVSGIALCFAGVTLLVGNQISATSGIAGAAPCAQATALAAAAGLTATALLGIAASYTKRYLSDIDPLVIAAGSLVGASIVLLPLAAWAWPATPISMQAWLAALALGVACTGVAYVLYFRLLTAGGPTHAMTATFVIPVFGILWDSLFLSLSISIKMMEGCAIVLIGTVFATGLIERLRSQPS